MSGYIFFADVPFFCGDPRLYFDNYVLSGLFSFCCHRNTKKPAHFHCQTCFQYVQGIVQKIDGGV